MLTAVGPSLLAASGAALVILTRQIDISMGAQFAWCSVLAGTAAAAGTVNCAPYGPASAADVQAAAASGGTVTIYGVCHGTVQLTTSVPARVG